MSLVYGNLISGLKLMILDSIDPEQVSYAAKMNPIASTLFIISSKSGGTAEVNALFNFFWERTQRLVGDRASEHFIAITDPGTSLEKLATEHKFRKIFLADPNVGGRFSALSAFGLVPAALMGIDVNEFLQNSARMADECGPEIPLERNPGILLGAVLGEAYNRFMDKLSIIADPEVAPFGTWLEQLVAESSGKQGKGIVPIHGETPASPDSYGTDRFFIYLRRNGGYDRKVNVLQKAGYPVVVQDIYDNVSIASRFYQWEVAISTMCSIIGVNPFDQPDVQDSKNRTLAKIAYYKVHHSFDEGVPIFEEQGIYLYEKKVESGETLTNIMRNFLASGTPGDYIAINAFLPRNRKNESSLQGMRKWIMVKTRLATMVGFGPRYLHSTGQLHKGGANNGLFLVITTDHEHDVEIPHEGLSFGTLEHGQALGDLEALDARDRRILRIHLASPKLLRILVDKLTRQY
jgi:transaldolase/glucose-6-phosphate isomerase